MYETAYRKRRLEVFLAEGNEDSYKSAAAYDDRGQHACAMCGLVAATTAITATVNTVWGPRTEIFF